MSFAKYVDRCKILCDMAEGICSRAYFLKSQSALSCMTTAEWAKVRQKADKVFPDTTEVQKVQGYDALRSSGAAVLEELQWVYDIFVDAAEFNDAALELLNEMPNEILAFNLWKNKGISLLYLDLLSWYIRVVMMVASVEDKKVYVSLFNMTHAAVHNTTDINMPRVIQIVHAVENPQNHFIHEFKHKDTILGSLLVQFQDVLVVRADTDTLKNKNILNPVDDGDLMGLPSVRPLSTTKEHFSMYTELAEAHRYQEYVIFALLACPILLYRQECLDLFRLVASETFVVTLYRDLVINIHLEFESISNGSQIKKDSNVARNYKLKPHLKEIAKDAAVRTGLVHRERRTLIRGELANLNHLFSLSPGLLGPKFPMVVAACSMARSELLHYFSHIGQEVRKDVKKSYNPDDYQPVEVMSLFGELYKLHDTCVAYAKVIQNYYVEYLCECDALAVEKLNRTILRADSESSFAHKVMNNIQLTLGGLVSEDPETCQLKGVRMDWDRFACYFSSNVMHSNPIAKSEQFENLTKRMNSVLERSNFVDNLDIVFRNYFIPYNLWWFRGHVKELFIATLGDVGSRQSVCEYAPALLKLPQSATLSCHDDCPEEWAVLGENSIRFCDSCLKDISAHVESAVVKLWDYYQSLDNMVQPLEAANRLERTQQAKKQATHQVSQPPLPGYESTFMYRPTISNLLQVKRNLVEVVSAMDLSGKFVVFDREYNIGIFLRKQIYLLFEQRMKRFLFKEDTDIERPSVALQKIIVGCQAIQDVITLIDGDTSSITRNVFFSNFVSLDLPPPGTPLHVSPQKEGSGSPLINRIASWFVRMIDLAATTDSGLVWVVSQKMFARTKNAFPIDMFLNHNDVTALCTLIGSQGVRVINAELLKVVVQKIERMKEFVSANSAELTEFSANYYQSISAAKQLKNLSGFFQDATACGVALAMREILCSAMGTVMDKQCPLLGEMSQLVTEAVDPWTNFSDVAGVHCLAADCGFLSNPDLSLVAALEGLMDNNFLNLLAPAFAALLAAPQWANAIYFPALEAFGGNEHCIVLTLARLLECFISAPNGGSNPTAKQTIKNASAKFVEIASHVLVMLRNFEGEEMNKEKPLRAMVFLLELFVRFSPVVNRGTLEKFLPYALIHDCHVDIALGKTCYTDAFAEGFDKV